MSYLGEYSGRTPASSSRTSGETTGTIRRQGTPTGTRTEDYET